MTDPDRVATASDPAGSGPSVHAAAAGVRLTIAGALIAVLAPLAGFLGGSVVGDQGAGPAGLSPLFFWMFAGLVGGGIGGILAILGALRWTRARHHQAATDRASGGSDLDRADRR